MTSSRKCFYFNYGKKNRDYPNLNFHSLQCFYYIISPKYDIISLIEFRIHCFGLFKSKRSSAVASGTYVVTMLLSNILNCVLYLFEFLQFVRIFFFCEIDYCLEENRFWVLNMYGNQYTI